MSLTVTHAKVSAIADDPAASAAGEVLPSDWNAAHTVAFTGPVALPYATASMEWEATDGKGFGFGFSEDSDPLDNHIWNHGFNLGTISDPSEPTLFISMESNYEADGANFMEYHLNYVPVGGSGALRPFSVDIDRSTDNIRFQICAEPLWFGVPDGSKTPVTWSFTGADENFTDDLSAGFSPCASPSPPSPCTIFRVFLFEDEISETESEVGIGTVEFPEEPSETRTPVLFGVFGVFGVFGALSS